MLHGISEGLAEQQLVERMINSVRVSEVVSKERHSKHTPERVSEIIGCGSDEAKQILGITTQNLIRTAVYPLFRKYRNDHLWDSGRVVPGQWGMDHLESGVKSIRGFTGGFIITSGSLSRFYFYGTVTKNQHDATYSRDRFVQDVGVPSELTCNYASSFVGRHTVFQDRVRSLHIKMLYAEPGRHEIPTLDVEIREI